MQFLITMTDIEGKWDALSEANQELVMKRHELFRAALEAEGRFVTSYHLRRREDARTVRMDAAGGLTVEDGPYSRAPESVGGYYIIEADSMDDAILWAKRGRFMVGANEVRQIHED